LSSGWVEVPEDQRASTSHRCAQQVRACYHQDSYATGRAIAEKIPSSLSSCPIPEVARLGRTLPQWRAEFLGYFDTDGANNGGTEAINGLIELHRRVARGFRTARTTGSGCSSSAADYCRDPTLIGEEPEVLGAMSTSGPALPMRMQSTGQGTIYGSNCASGPRSPSGAVSHGGLG